MQIEILVPRFFGNALLGQDAHTWDWGLFSLLLSIGLPPLGQSELRKRQGVPQPLNYQNRQNLQAGHYNCSLC